MKAPVKGRAHSGWWSICRRRSPKAVRAARRFGITNADVIFNAIEQVGPDKLAELVPAGTAARTVPPGGLFSRQVGSAALNKVRFEARLPPADL